jgi:hypothetical protein
MGRNNQQRRAAAKRRRQRAARPHDHGGDGAGQVPPRGVPSTAALVDAVVAAWRVDEVGFEQLLGALVERADDARAVVEQRIDVAVEALWHGGWTPADLVHVTGRQLSPAHAEEATERVLLDGRRRTERGQAMHPRWREQLDALAQERGSPEPLGLEQQLRRMVELLTLVVRLPSVTTTIPRPGAIWSERSAVGVHLDARMLARVRALLAKAESTSFEEEAEAFTAKAQELIARYAIDEALLHTVDDIGDPSVRRVLIDDPYADGKAALLGEVADANRCRVVHSPALGWVTAFGYDHDLDALELLGMSLLTQATTAMLRHGPQRDVTGTSRTRAFRRAFLYGFAQRIGERLRRATEEQVAASADDAGRLVPVLDARDERLRAAQAAAFPEVVSRTTSLSDATGWYAGQAAAEHADLAMAAHRLGRR